VLHGNVQVLPLQTPTVPAGPPVHSELLQQAGRLPLMHKLVPVQFR